MNNVKVSSLTYLSLILTFQHNFVKLVELLENSQSFGSSPQPYSKRLKSHFFFSAIFSADSRGLLGHVTENKWKDKHISLMLSLPGPVQKRVSNR